MYLQVCGVEEKGENTCALAHLATPWWGWARTHDVGMNSPSKSGPKPQTHGLLLSFIFATSQRLIRFDRDKLSRLQNAIILEGYSLYIRVATTEIATYQQPRKHQHI
jgi:hypothetical protein